MNKLDFCDAVSCYMQALTDAYGHCEGLIKPDEILSQIDKTGRWILRDRFGSFMAYVTSNSKVLDRYFREFGEVV